MTHYNPADWGYDPECTFCGLNILDDEDWEGDRKNGAKHRSPPNGCVKALSREVRKLKEENEGCEMDKCSKCKGTGTVLVNPAPFGLNPGNRMEKRACPSCGGTGKKEQSDKS